VDGTTSVVETPGRGDELHLRPPLPNPFNPRTTIAFDLPAASRVRLSVFDLRGRLVRTLLDESRSAGRHDVVWEGRSDQGRRVASGVYLLRLEANGAVETRRVALVK
jgi:hypothetical protein